MIPMYENQMIYYYLYKGENTNGKEVSVISYASSEMVRSF